mmetsp:Transcript_7490/g.19078  ORF Transcript_7490/g.19078 Transcript_7490/m.19078 type:complete len:184 (+) Transcript_7490:257-808(+)|eukprot:CAMPEP_0119541308 /NCGR_PEP_ID=MMETSP1344-20130328/52881_1 /TAXON_ID=236787 /ORGANISM="Florenciella parvula, Strain CCMP2471" /LENGTH=183 /DNA_ID=CAMNT_0007585263 /DNA_START=108 /DNA_END=659 /DNA_ORIENTATION=-
MARSSFAVLLALVASISSATGFMPAPTGVAFASRRSAPASVTMGAHGKFGLFSPAVLGMKAVIGETELNKLRAKVIGEHSKVIAAFVDTHDTKFGQLALSKLFEAADADGNGTLDKEEIRAALQALGFNHLKDSQIEGIVSRADVDDNEVIDFEEFCKSTPATLRTNLIKLAKANGDDLGFLI